MSFTHVLFGFSGRINRAKYWFAGLFWFLAFLLGACSAIGTSGSAKNFSLTDVGSTIAAFAGFIALVLVVVIPMCVSLVAIGIKRLHDRNRSGWWLLLFYCGGAVLEWVGDAIGNETASLVLSLGGTAIAIWAFVELWCLRGTTGPNQYGPDPLAPEQFAPAH